MHRIRVSAIEVSLKTEFLEKELQSAVVWASEVIGVVILIDFDLDILSDLGVIDHEGLLELEAGPRQEILLDLELGELKVQADTQL